MLGYRSEVIPLTRAAFGEDGKGRIVGMVADAFFGESFVGLVLQNNDSIYAHPRLIEPDVRLLSGDWIAVTLEGDEVVARRCEPGTGNVRPHAGEWRAPPVEVGPVPVDLVVLLLERLEMQNGACMAPDCSSSRRRALTWRQTALVRLESGTPLVVLCGRCYDRRVAADLSFATERTLLDGRRVFPFATVAAAR